MQNDNTSLILASARGHEACVSALIGASADVNAANEVQCVLDAWRLDCVVVYRVVLFVARLLKRGMLDLFVCVFCDVIVDAVRQHGFDARQ